MKESQNSPPIPAERVERVAVIGAGTIGASWAACFLANGLEVIAVDPVRAETDLRQAVEGMMPALVSLGMAAGADTGRLRFLTSVGHGLADVQFVQENVPERLEAKHQVLRELETVIDPQVVVSSSSTAMIPTDIQSGAAYPHRLVVGHPFNPPHLIPLVEIAGGRETAASALSWTVAFYRSIGKTPVLMKKEVYGHIANRLAAALFQEAVHLVAEGIATVGDIDQVITQGPGLRWALQGPFTTYHLAGGREGIEHYLTHLGPTQEARWRSLGEPVLTDDLVALIVGEVREALAGYSLAELADIRDRGLLELHRLKEELPFRPSRDSAG